MRIRTQTRTTIERRTSTSSSSAAEARTIRARPTSAKRPRALSAATERNFRASSSRATGHLPLAETTDSVSPFSNSYDDKSALMVYEDNPNVCDDVKDDNLRSTRRDVRLDNHLSAKNFNAHPSSELNIRRTFAENLPTFSGDPLDWLEFKLEFDLSNHEYCDRQNWLRLYDAISGEARESVKMLFAVGISSQKIMQSLEVRFGHPTFISKRIIEEVRKLLSMYYSNKISFLEFATKLKNAVTAIKALKSLGYLYSPELAAQILLNLPNCMQYNYLKYAACEGRDKPDLEKIAEFLFKEAKISIAAGTIEFM